MKNIFLRLSYFFLVMACVRAEAMSMATYEVPVKEPELKSYAKFILPSFSSQVEGDRLTVRYTLPRAVTGAPVEIEMQGVVDEKNPTVLKGEYGEMTCQDSVCKTNHSYVLNIDLKAVGAYLKSLNLTDDEYEKRFQVAKEFSGDPGGVLYWPKSVRSRRFRPRQLTAAFCP